MVRLIFAVIVVSGLSACSSFTASRYAISVDNVAEIKRTVAVTPGTRVSVAPFTAAPGKGKREFSCRLAGPVRSPDGQPFQDYIRKALIDELRLAEAYAESGSPTIVGHLRDIAFSSFEGIWRLTLDVQSDTGTSYSVSEVYAFGQTFVGVSACNEGARALLPATQNLIKKVVTHPKFSDLIGAS